jgi:hypothetical protein
MSGFKLASRLRPLQTPKKRKPQGSYGNKHEASNMRCAPHRSWPRTPTGMVITGPNRDTDTTLTQRFTRLDDRAAKIIFRDNNKVRVHLLRGQRPAQPRLYQTLQEGMVDLHGLYVPEVIEYAKKAIESAACRRDDEICFIVGVSYNETCGVYARTLGIGSTPRQRDTCRQLSVEASASPSRTL